MANTPAAETAKMAVINTNLNEEAWVVEILGELRHCFPSDDSQLLLSGLKAQLKEYAQTHRIGFFLDEFGAKEVREITTEAALVLLETDATWDIAQEPKLHVFWLDA